MRPAELWIGPTDTEVKNYYFSIQEAAEYLNVPQLWIKHHLTKLPDRIVRHGTWYFSPDDYHKLRELRDA